MSLMKKFAISLLVWLGFAFSAAAEEGYHWYKFPLEKMNDMAALQHGGKLFVNYCLNCHSANYMRYNRMRDIGLTEDEIKKNMLFATDKIGDTMKISFDPKQAKDWLAAAPPDLTVIARSRSDAGKGSGADYLYTYLRTFYRDDTRPTGWNNLAYPNVAMPHVLWQLQGQRTAKFVDEKDPKEPGVVRHHFEGFETVTPGLLDAHEYDESVADLVAYMQWMGEPAQAKRVQIGVWVLIFLAVMSVITWRLNASYWKNVK